MRFRLFFPLCSVLEPCRSITVMQWFESTGGTGGFSVVLACSPSVCAWLLSGHSSFHPQTKDMDMGEKVCLIQKEAGTGSSTPVSLVKGNVVED